MQKKETQAVKGVAILAMIWLHLFNRASLVDLCTPFVYVGDVPLCSYITKALTPVAIFLILSGYGLYVVNQRGDKNRKSRILRLYGHYWVILGIFLIIGCFIKPEKYPGNIRILFDNIIGLHTSYNGEMWFLLPYTMVSLFGVLIFRFIDKIRRWYISLFIIYSISTFAGWLISRGYMGINQHHIMWVIANAITFLLPFTLGALAAKYHFFDKCKNVQFLRQYSFLVLSVVFGIQCIKPIIPFYSFCITTCIVVIFSGFNNKINSFFVALGDNSMNMWMIHSWFCYHLFSGFTYSLRFPIVIFVVITSISYFISLGINCICKPIESVMLKKSV